MNEFDWPYQCERHDFPAMDNPFAPRNRAGLLASPYPRCPNPELGQLVVPTGMARYARAMIVLSDGAITELAEEPDLQLLRYEYGGKFFQWSMTRLPAIPVGATPGSKVWLVPLVDRRYHWARQSISLNPAAVASWASLISTLSEAMGVTIAVDGPINAAYGVPDREFVRDASSSLGAILDLVALSIGKRAIIDSRGVVLTSADISDDHHGMNLTLITPSLMLGGSTGAVPARPAVIGRRSFDYWGGSSEAWRVTPAGPGDESGVIYSANWLESFTGTEPCHQASGLASQTAANELAARLQLDAADWQGLQHHFACAGVLPIELTGHDDYLAIGIDTDPKFPKLVSVLKSLPARFCPRVNASQTAKYVHPHEVARFAIHVPPAGDAPPEECLPLPGRLIPASGDYDGSSLQNLKITSLDGKPGSLHPGTEIVCAYQAGLGWYRLSAPEANPGVVAVEIEGESPYHGQTVDDLDYHALEAEIKYRPAGTPGTLRHELAGKLIVHDPTECLFKPDEDAETFAGKRAFASLMYGGPQYQRSFAFKGTASGDNDVAPGDSFPTQRPSTDAKKFGWLTPSADLWGSTTSIGPNPDRDAVFAVELPEPGVYSLQLRYGDVGVISTQRIEIYDGNQLLQTVVQELGAGLNELLDVSLYFRWGDRPQLRIKLYSTDGNQSRMMTLAINQVSPATRWQLISRCGEGGDSGDHLFGFIVTALISDASFTATIHPLNGGSFGASIGSFTVYDPAEWFHPRLVEQIGLCELQGGKYYAIQAPCPG